MSAPTEIPSLEALRSYVIKTFENANGEFVQDLEALSETNLGKSWSGSRTAYDIAYEVGVVNRRAAMMCREMDPGAWPWEFGNEWLKAPDELQSKSAIVKHMEETGQELLDSIGRDVEKIVRIVGPGGDGTRPIYQIVIGAAKHTFYHDAQLNFMQQLTGDMDVHWK
jgi:hypothetical protein